MTGKIEQNRLLLLRKFVNRIRKRFYDTVTDYNFVKKCLLLEIPGYLGLLLVGVIIAFAFGGSDMGPGKYYIWTNYISDLGSIRFTPAPYLYDLAAILGGGLTIPCTFFIERLLVPLPQKPDDYNKTTRLRYRLGSYAFLCSIIGNIGYIGIGIFSEDRNYMDIMHLVTGAMAFGGFIGGAFLWGLIILLYDIKIPKMIGLYGVLGPITFVGLTGAIFLFNPVLIPLFEWLLLFSILIWIILLSLAVNFNKELHI